MIKINELKLVILSEAVKNGHVCGKFISKEHHQDFDKVGDIIRQLCVDGFLCKNLIVDNGSDICGEPNSKSYEAIENPSILISKENTIEIYTNSNVIKGSSIQGSEINSSSKITNNAESQPIHNQNNGLIYKIFKFGILPFIWILIELFTEYGIIQKLFNGE